MKAQVSAIMAAAAALVVLSGCVSEERVARDIRANRTAARRALLRTVPDPNKPPRYESIEGTLTIEEALELARVHNQDLQAARQRLLEAEGQVLEAAATAMPSFTLSGHALAHDNEAPSSPSETYQWQLLARQPLYLGGLTSAALDAAATFGYLAQQEFRQTAQQVEQAVRAQYLTVLLTAELEQVAVQARRDAEENLRLVTARYEQGEALRFELLRSQVRLRAIQAEIIQLHNAYLVSLAALLDTMGVSQLSRVELADALVYGPLTVAADACRELAIEQHPGLLMQEAMVRLARNNVLAAQSGNRPQVYLQGSYQQDYPGSTGFFTTGERSWERSMSGGITVEWPFFDGRATEGRVVQARAQLHRQEISLRQTEQGIQFQVTQALLDLESAREFVESQMGNVADAEESLRLARVNYREGANTALDVQNEELALAQARSDYIQAVHDYQLAQLNLAAAVGLLGERSLPTME